MTERKNLAKTPVYNQMKMTGERSNFSANNASKPGPQIPQGGNNTNTPSAANEDVDAYMAYVDHAIRNVSSETPMCAYHAQRSSLKSTEGMRGKDPMERFLAEDMSDQCPALCLQGPDDMSTTKLCTCLDIIQATVATRGNASKKENTI